MAKAGKADQNNEILEYALRHLEKERDEIQVRIDGIRRQLARKPVGRPRSTPQETTAAPAAKRVLSEAARRRIAAAQKKRWAEHRKNQKAAARQEM
jgi:hypothetical protein